MKGEKLILIFFFLLLLFVYGPGVEAPFVYDDRVLIQGNVYLKQGSFLKLLGEEFTSQKIKPGMYRPLTILSFYLNYLITGDGPAGYRIFNLLLHAGISWLLYLLLLRMFPGLNKMGAFLLSLFYLLLPANSQACLYISARFTLMFVFFYLLSFLSYLNRKIFRSLCFFMLALLSKESALSFPLAILLYESFTLRDWKYCRKYLFLSLLPVSIFFLLRLLLLERGMGYQLDISYARFLFYFKSLAFFFQNLFLSFSLPVIEHDLNRLNLNLGYFLLGLMLLFALWAILKKKVLLGFVFLFPLLIVFSFSLMLPLDFPALGMEYRFHLANLFYPFLLAFLFLALKEKERLISGLQVGLFSLSVLSMPFLWLRAYYWKEPLLLWKNTVEKYPHLYAPHLNYSQALFEKGMFEEALQEAQAAVFLKGDSYLAHYNLGSVLAVLGRYQEAKSAFEKAVFYGDFFAPAHFNLGLTYLILSNKIKAKEEFEKAEKLGIEINPQIRRALKWER